MDTSVLLLFCLALVAGCATTTRIPVTTLRAMATEGDPVTTTDGDHAMEPHRIGTIYSADGSAQGVWSDSPESGDAELILEMGDVVIERGDQVAFLLLGDQRVGGSLNSLRVEEDVLFAEFEDGRALEVDLDFVDYAEIPGPPDSTAKIIAATVLVGIIVVGSVMLPHILSDVRL